MAVELAKPKRRALAAQKPEEAPKVAAVEVPEKVVPKTPIPSLPLPNGAVLK
jgi:hypothetical protein